MVGHVEEDLPIAEVGFVVVLDRRMVADYFETVVAVAAEHHTETVRAGSLEVHS